ncbi:hypothetical protein OESDEN_19209 [Oesophagostomum dentatum]|uniref:Uncharacterized protein n=1 Tax=Oesophagostomum dentatum TaxID=61180 RepID=A0A0B1SD27_OESDE|nr:hypothetical protein OESDEN_19209 [Oesophagostomum dentatum]
MTRRLASSRRRDVNAAETGPPLTPAERSQLPFTSMSSRNWLMQFEKNVRDAQMLTSSMTICSPVVLFGHRTFRLPFVPAAEALSTRKMFDKYDDLKMSVDEFFVSQSP